MSHSWQMILGRRLSLAFSNFKKKGNDKQPQSFPLDFVHYIQLAIWKCAKLSVSFHWDFAVIEELNFWSFLCCSFADIPLIVCLDHSLSLSVQSVSVCICFHDFPDCFLSHYADGFTYTKCGSFVCANILNTYTHMHVCVCTHTRYLWVPSVGYIYSLNPYSHCDAAT